MHISIVQSEESGSYESDNDDGPSDDGNSDDEDSDDGVKASVPPSTDAEESNLRKQVDIEMGDGAERDGLESGDHPVTHVAVEIHKEVEPSLKKRKRVGYEKEVERIKSLYRTRARQRASMDAKKQVLRPRGNG